jgi:hypothetical protein
MDRDDFIKRIAAAILAGWRKSEFPVDPASATAYATSLADKLPGLFRTSPIRVDRDCGGKYHRLNRRATGLSLKGLRAA